MLRNTPSPFALYTPIPAVPPPKLTLTPHRLRLEVAAVKAGSGGGLYTRGKLAAAERNVYYKDKIQWNITHDDELCTYVPPRYECLDWPPFEGTTGQPF